MLCVSRAAFNGTFSHIGDKITFEVLAANFGLDADPALGKIGALVHYLDVGGITVAEAAGMERIISGARRRFSSDDEFLVEAQKILDFIYGGYSQ